MTPIEHTFSARKQSYQLVANRSSASSLCLFLCNPLKLFSQHHFFYFEKKESYPVPVAQGKPANQAGEQGH